MLKIQEAPRQSTPPHPYICKGPELFTPALPAHEAREKSARWAVHDDANPLTSWPLCESCARVLGYIW
jgi:hypothetical protein